MTNQSKKKVFLASLEHRGGKKLSQRGTEFFHEIKATPTHPRLGRGGKNG